MRIISMPVNTYQAKFTASNGEEIIADRNYAKPLGFAWRVEYVNAKDETQKAVKHGFSATREAAEKQLVLPKRLKLTHSQIVETVNVGTVASKAKTPAKPKATKPCKVGEFVTFELATHLPGITATVGGEVAKLGRKYAYVKVAGALDPIKVAFDNIRPVPSSPAHALAA
jgi:hypothetical protein